MVGRMKLSVCMATYQGERYVREQVESILSQLTPHDEIVISDDCSTDGTLRVLEDLSDARIRVYTNSTNLGYSKNFANALQRATGDIVFIADQDDVWLPDKVATMVEALQSHDLVVSDVVVVSDDLSEVHPSHFQLYGTEPGFLPNLLRTRYIGAAMAMHRRVLDLALPLPPRSSLCAYDYWIAVVAEAYFDVGLVERPLMLYRRHDLTASTGGSESPYSVRHRIAVRAYCLAHLIARARRRRSSSSARLASHARRDSK